MVESEEGNNNGEFSLPLTSAADLRGRQSVRATFKLSEACIDAISIVAAQLGIKQKSLFDHLIDDIASLNSIARGLQHSRGITRSRVQKTYVLNRKTLSSLESVSKAYRTSRDTLVEYSVQRLLPIIARERQKHEKRKVVFDQITKNIKDAKRILKTARDALGEEDPVYERLKLIIHAYENGYASIQSYIERGKIIEKFEPESMV